jgi:diaminopimelate epimerase
MAGAGNDFVMIDNRAKVLTKPRPETARRLCDRKYSIGADGLILLEKSKKADIRMRIFNPDGSEAEMCGNGVRCIAKFAVDHRITKRALSIETLAGLIRAEVRREIVKAKLPDPKNLRTGLQVDIGGKGQRLHFIDTGVPHAVLVVDSLAHCDVEGLGRAIRYHERFAPRGTNVDFVSIRGRQAVEVRTYERGVEDETLSCGTGSTAAALVAAALKDLKPPVLVYTKGGETLKIYFTRKGAGFTDVYLEGRVQKSFEGRVNL